MSEEKQNESQIEANKTLRVLKGEKLKYTVTIHFKSGRVYEFQAKEMVKPEFNHEARELWLRVGYESYVCAAADVELIHNEENPI